MKKLIKSVFAGITIFLLLTSCGERGPVGPEGPRGPQGPAGPSVLPTSFEFEVDLLQANNFEFFSDIPSQIEVLESDVVLAFVFEDYIEEEDLEVWRKLPLIEFNQDGTQVLDYDFTFVDVRIFLHANYQLGAADEYAGLLIRAVHVPADFVNAGKMKSAKDADTFHELKSLLGVEIQNLGKIK